MVSADPKCVYVLYGSDAFLRDETRRALVQRIIGDADPQTAVTHFDAMAELAEVLDELRTLPFLAPDESFDYDGGYVAILQKQC